MQFKLDKCIFHEHGVQKEKCMMLVLYGQHHWVYNCTSASCFIRWRVYVRVTGPDILLLQHSLGFSSLHYLRPAGMSDLSSDVTPFKQKLLRLQKMWVRRFTPPPKKLLIGLGCVFINNWRIQGGPNSFIFTQFFGEKVEKIIPLWELAPPSGKSWIRHCINCKNNRVIWFAKPSLFSNYKVMLLLCYLRVN